jgi:bifunctional UDP-N-acetylglucosamine pyrophosphorylase / glucosamine-1-phosphate N-acetyltransferase
MGYNDVICDSLAFATHQPTCATQSPANHRLVTHIRAWPSGKAVDFGSTIPGSNPGARAAILSRDGTPRSPTCAASGAAETKERTPRSNFQRMRRVGIVILAAGKGTRMRSRRPKVTHPVGGRPMLEHVLRAASEAVAVTAHSAAESASGDAEDHSPEQPPASSTTNNANDAATNNASGAATNNASGAATAPRYVVVVGHERDQVRAAVPWTPPAADAHTLSYVVQEPQLGTGHAVASTRSALTAQDAENATGAASNNASGAATAATAPDTILVLYGDTPLIRAETLRDLLARHAQSGATLTFLTGIADGPTDYGRVIRDSAGRVRGIVEQRHATPEELRIREVNSGIYCFDAAWLWSWLDHLEPHPNGEYYLTDLVDLAVREGCTVATVTAPLDETMGVNDRVQLAEAEALLRRRVLRDLMLSGVTVEDPATTYVESGVRIGQDTILRPGTTLRGDTTIGEDCEIGPYSVIRDSVIGDGCAVVASWLDGATMESGSRIGPMSRLRPGAHLKPGANVGNFGEVKNATIGEQVQMHHFSYIGDATVGAGTNIGAGTITMNYDGKQKHHTEIGERAFIGSDSLLRAPVTIGDGATTGAGAVVTRDVPPGELAVGMPARLIRRIASRRDSSQTNDAHAAADTAHSTEQGAQPSNLDRTERTEYIESAGAHESAGAAPAHPPERHERQGLEGEARGTHSTGHGTGTGTSNTSTGTAADEPAERE